MKHKDPFAIKQQHIYIALLRISLGVLFFYAGITKLLNPAWSAEGYLKSAKTVPALYHYFAQPDVLPMINIINEWGLTLLGVSLMLGIAVKLSSYFGSLLMFLYYVPILHFPFVGDHAFLIDEHIIYIVALLLLASFHAGRYFGLEAWCSNLPICSKYPKLRRWVG